MRLHFPQPFKCGLFARIVVLVSLLIICIVALNTILAIQRESRILTMGLVEKNTMLAEHLAGITRTAFMSLDWYSVQNAVATSTDSKEVLYCRIAKPDGEIFLADDKRLYGQKNDQPLPPNLDKLIIKDAISGETQEAIKLFIKPVPIGKDVWSIWLAVSLQPIQQAKNNIIFHSLLEGALIILLGALVIFWLSRSITRPIDILVEGTRQVAGGNLDYQIEVTRNDEIGKLAAAFNRMTHQLLRSSNQINAHSKILEEQVEERTRELRHEIDQRKIADEKRMRLEAQLQRALKMEAIGTLAGGVAHDLNNILCGLISYPELILMDLDEESPLYPMVSAIKRSGERAATIVQDLLTLARRGVAVQEVINLNLIIDHFLKSPECEKVRRGHPGIKVETDLETGLLNISGSPVHLTATLMNLVVNAAESIAGAGKIRISTANAYIGQPVGSYPEVAEGDYAVLTIADTGAGMTPEDKEKIFEPFYTKKVMGKSGTGLGMTVVWGTVKDHGGYIDVQSALGDGTTIKLFFPVTREALADKVAPGNTFINEYRGNGESILVVDDVAEQREIASEILGRLNYHVATVESGEQAVAHLRNQSADLVILDMIMEPGMDGADTYKEIIKEHPGQKAIIVSGFSENARVKYAQSLGAGAYVKKPYLSAKLGQAVKAELSACPLLPVTRQGA